MTEKLFYLDSHLKQTEARVLSCRQERDGYAVVLDRTVLFYNGGGQPCDLGRIGDAAVTDVREEGEDIVHFTDKPLAEGSMVTVRLDWERRFDFMQQHTGEHLLSYAIYHLFGLHNVGFHLAESYATIDFDRPLSRENLAEAEDCANRLIWEDLPVHANFYDTEEEVRALPLRKQAEGISLPIRVVTIEGADACTCCAPHCKKTGEIGLVRIMDSMSYKGGSRLTFFCGKRAALLARKEHEILDSAARSFSCGREDVLSTLEQQREELSRVRSESRQTMQELDRILSAELVGKQENLKECGLVCCLVRPMDGGRLKSLAQMCLSERTLCVLFSEGKEGLGYVVASGEKIEADSGELIQAVNAATGGKGGGRGHLAQGRSASCPAPEETVLQIREYLIRRFGGRKQAAI